MPNEVIRVIRYSAAVKSRQVVYEDSGPRVNLSD
jgi:hypothetical protein